MVCASDWFWQYADTGATLRKVLTHCAFASEHPSTMTRDSSNMTRDVHACNELGCFATFATEKALLQHKRIRHGYKDKVTRYIDGSGTFPMCKTNFRTRLRVLAHVTDNR